MQQEKLLTYSIISLDTEHIDEVCEDLNKQYQTGVSGCALFMMPLVPEGKIPANKAESFCEKYMMFKKRLDKMSVPNGILIQATIGHGWTLSEMFPYQQFTNLTDGNKVAIVCPYDKGFQKYIYDAFVTVTKCNPDMIMVDDDFRLLLHQGKGCACPLHMSRLNELMGSKLSREELVSEIEKDSEKGKKYYNRFVETQRESLIETAKVMRTGIDSVNPKQIASYCCVGNNVEFAAEIIDVLAGEGNPKIVRMNNAAYCKSDYRAVTESYYKAATQIKKLSNFTDYILAETDTCPQNRYSTSASMLHAHYTGSILEGANGAKQWITRLSSYEPESGTAYRNKLSKYSMFYEKLAEIAKGIQWSGFRIPVTQKAEYSYFNDGYDQNLWYSNVFNRLGLPTFFSNDNCGIACMEGNGHLRYSDEEMTEMLKGTMFLASDTAMQLTERGFGEYIGVDFAEHTGKSPKTEESIYGKYSVQSMFKKMIPQNDDVVELSSVYSVVNDIKEKICPGVVRYNNPYGGIIYTFCGTPDAPFDLGAIFSFLNSSRKKEFVQTATECGQLAAYYPGDEEIYFKAGKTKEGNLLCSLLNVGLDKIENVELVINNDVNEIDYLDCNGNWKSVEFEVRDDKYILDVECNTLDFLIFLVK